MCLFRTRVTNKVGKKVENINELSEEKLIRISLWSSLAFSIVGIGVGIWTQSQMILFDGMYSFVSLLLSGFSFFAIKFMNKEDHETYPFGKGSIEPIIVIFKYIVLTILILQSFFSAFIVMLSGGRIIPFGAGFIYSFLSTIGCYVMYKVLKDNNKQQASPLIDAEKSQWAVDTLISFGVFAGFVLTMGLQKFELFPSFVPYADSLMVMLVTAIFLRVPMREIMYGLRQLIGRKPKEEEMPLLEKKVDTIRNQYKMEDAVVRWNKVGRTLRVEVDFVVSPASHIDSIEKQDAIRQEIADVLGEPNKTWMTVSFTGKKKWAF